jgi:hypothetical protein
MRFRMLSADGFGHTFPHHLDLLLDRPDMKLKPDSGLQRQAPSNTSIEVAAMAARWPG